MSWQRLSRRSERYTSLAFRQDGQILIAGALGGWVRWWQTADGAPLPITMRQRQPVWSVALAPDGQQWQRGWRTAQRPSGSLVSRFRIACSPAATARPRASHLPRMDNGSPPGMMVGCASGGWPMGICCGRCLTHRAASP